MAIEFYPKRPSDRPSTRIQVDTSALNGTASDSDKLLMLIGSAQGGIPNTVYKVRNLYDAKSIFRGGELLDALELAWNPSSEVPGAGDILAMRVEDAEAATLTQGKLTFNTRLYGDEANAVQISLSTPSLGGAESRVFTVDFAPDNVNQIFYDVGTIANITKAVDAPAYVGINVADNKLTISTGADLETAQPVTFQLGIGNYANSNALVSAINTVPGIIATVPTSRSKNINTYGIDDLAETEITSDGSVTLTALLADIVNMLSYNEYVEVEVPAELVVDGFGLDSNVVGNNVTLEDFELTNLTGGSQGTIPTTWADKFEPFAHEGGYYLVPLTADPAIHAEATTFVNERYANADPMRTIVGAGYDETNQQLLSRASALRNPRAMLVGFSGTTTLQDGRIKEIPAYLYAALVGGVASGIDIGAALTYKQINLKDLSRKFSPSQLDALNSGGVVMAEFVRDRLNTKFRIVDDVTTYNDTTNPVANQMGIGEASDFLVSELKITLDDNFIGGKVQELSPAMVKNHIQSFLDQKKRDNEIQDYNPEDVQVIIDGQTARISLVIFPTRSLKEINVSLVYNTQVLEA